MSEMPSLEQNQNIEQVEITQELWDNTLNYVEKIPKVSAEFLRSDIACRMIAEQRFGKVEDPRSEEGRRTTAERTSIIRGELGGEGVAEALIDQLQEQGKVDKKPLGSSNLDGFSVTSYRERQESAAKLNKRQRLLASKVGRSSIAPVVLIAKENFVHNTKTRPEFVSNTLRKITGAEKRQRREQENKSIKEKHQNAEEQWRKNRTIRLSVKPNNTVDTGDSEDTVSVSSIDNNLEHSDPPTIEIVTSDQMEDFKNRYNIVEENDHKELWEHFKNEVSKRIVDQHPTTNQSIEDLKKSIEQEVLDKMRSYVSDEELQRIRDRFTAFEEEDRRPKAK